MPHSETSKKYNNNKGITVIELLIVIAIIAILGLISVGPMLRWRANSFIETATNNLMSDFERAKIEAVRHGKNVSVMFSDNEETYHCFVDANQNGIYDNSEQLFFHRTVVGGSTGRVNIVIANGSNGHQGIIFTPRGFVTDTNSMQITITGLTNHSNLTRTITVNRIGNISSTATKN